MSRAGDGQRQAWRRRIEGPFVADHTRLAALSAQLAHTHQTLRDQLRDARAGGGDLLQHCTSFCAALDRHHTGEDAALFPALRRAHPELAAAVDKLVEDHGMIAGILHRVRELTAAGLGGDAVLREFDGLAAIMESHFRYEERTIGAAVDEAWARDVAAGEFLDVT